MPYGFHVEPYWSGEDEESKEERDKDEGYEHSHVPQSYAVVHKCAVTIYGIIIKRENYWSKARTQLSQVGQWEALGGLMMLHVWQYRGLQ